jgi:two-component system, sensor histidine kinase PdtaS
MSDRPVGPGELFFRELADNAPVMIWRSGRDKRCDWFNKPWLDFVGRTMTQELGNGWTENVHPDDLDRCLKIYLGSFDARQNFSMIYQT